MQLTKIRMLGHNNNLFMLKDLRNEIIKKFKLKISFNKKRDHANWCY